MLSLLLASTAFAGISTSPFGYTIMEINTNGTWRPNLTVQNEGIFFPHPDLYDGLDVDVTGEGINTSLPGGPWTIDVDAEAYLDNDPLFFNLIPYPSVPAGMELDQKVDMMDFTHLGVDETMLEHTHTHPIFGIRYFKQADETVCVEKVSIRWGRIINDDCEDKLLYGIYYPSQNELHFVFDEPTGPHGW